MLACDFFHGDWAVALQRVFVFFVLEVGNRGGASAGRDPEPGRLVDHPADSQSFDVVLADVGIRVVRIAPRCPRANCFAERFVRTLRAELTDRMLVFNQWHLRVVLAEYIRHYNGQRLHRARNLRPPQPTHLVADLSYERIKRRTILRGLINEYE